MSPTILAIDTATEACSVALRVNDQVYSHFEICPQQHSQRILPLVDEILAKANISLKQVQGLAFGRGPGSFTGVRIGIGITQGLAFGADLPVLPISNLQMIAQGAIRRTSQHQHIAVAIDARMNEVYFAEFKVVDGIAIAETEESVITPEALKNHIEQKNFTQLAAGTGWQAHAPLFESLFESNQLITADAAEDAHLPNAVDMLAVAERMLANNESVKAVDAEPVYVRNTVTWKKLPGK